MKGPSCTVVIVDDDPDMMRIMSRTLEEAGYQVVQAFGAEDALRKVKLKRPGLLVTDLVMPKVSGAQLIRAIKTDPQVQKTSCVAVTAHLFGPVAQSARQAGCDGFVTKPFRRDRLLQEVARHFRRADWALPEE